MASVIETESGTITIKTDYKYRPLQAFIDLPEKVKSEFEYVHEEERFSPRFVLYRGMWYDTHEYMVIDKTSPFALHKVKWHAYASDSYFSGTLLRFDREGESVIVARFYC